MSAMAPSGTSSRKGRMSVASDIRLNLPRVDDHDNRCTSSLGPGLRGQQPILRQARCPLRAAARQAGISPATPVVRTLHCTRDTGRFTVGPALLNAPGDADSELWEAGVSQVA